MADTTLIIKPGYKTTEFWLSVAAMILGTVYASGLIGGGTQVDHVLGIAATILTGLGYSVSRSIVKK